MDGQDRFTNMLGQAAMDVWGDMPRDIIRRSRAEHAEELDTATRVYVSRSLAAA
ncbi:MAG: hypothetical protein JWP25_7248 [Bradyrhizobium sp.]|jgi:hypothetical protein|nr:hypothetical protein [Bradyrhizobium sp.]